jgi:hypothetical protein
VDPVPAEIEAHMLELGFQSSRAYLDWCEANDFFPSLEKSRREMKQELEAYSAIKERQRRHERLHKHPKAFLESVCLGTLASAELDRPKFKRVAEAIEQSNADTEVRKSLLAMLHALSRYDDLIFETVPGRADTPLIRGLIKLHDRKVLWLRPLESWKPKSKNPLRRFGELTHHLFDRFGDVPRFMEAVWLRNDRPSWRFRDWYVHLGRGYNLRTAKTPVPLTKKMAHHFLQAPDDYTVEQAIRWGQLKALSAREATINAIVATRLGRSFQNEEFWLTVLRFFALNPMLDPRQIAPIVDYIQHQRFEPLQIELAPGVWRRDPPPEPRFSMSGRTADTLLRQVAAWHDALGRVSSVSSESYARAPFEGFVVERKEKDISVQWVIRQLMSARDLETEGRALSHCVASYHWSCSRGHCTIWSLSRQLPGGEYERRQTIEVDREKTIVQCRGLANRDPTPEEWSLVNAWASEAGLRVATYL